MGIGDMNQWRRIAVLPFCERLLGFSIPDDGKTLVVSYEGVHLLHLDDEVRFETDFDYAEYDIYDPDTGLARYRGQDYRIIGLHGGQAILNSPQGETLILDEKRETLSVVKGRDWLWSTAYENFSGDWVAATFSTDGQYIVLGCPYDFDLMILRRAEQ
jgi:hypothetical protein